MALISLTRLRLRSPVYLPLFFWHVWESTRQAQRAPGFVAGALARDPDGAFWTLTAWTDEASMRAYRNTAAHKRAMPKLMDWCDEAAVAHWEQEQGSLPNDAEALAWMSKLERASKVHAPSLGHAAGRVVPGGRAPKVLTNSGQFRLLEQLCRVSADNSRCRAAGSAACFTVFELWRRSR